MIRVGTVKVPVALTPVAPFNVSVLPTECGLVSETFAPVEIRVTLFATILLNDRSDIALPFETVTTPVPLVLTVPVMVALVPDVRLMLPLLAAVMVLVGADCEIPAVAVKLIALPLKAPPTRSASLAPVRVSCRVPLVALLAFNVTVPPAAVSLRIFALPLADIVIEVALVLLTRISLLVLLSVKVWVVRGAPVKLTPFDPVRFSDVAAFRPPTVKLIKPFVEVKLMLSADMLVAAPSVRLPLPEIDTEPEPTLVAVTCAPSPTVPPAESDTELAPVILAPAF